MRKGEMASEKALLANTAVGINSRVAACERLACGDMGWGGRAGDKGRLSPGNTLKPSPTQWARGRGSTFLTVLSMLLLLLLLLLLLVGGATVVLAARMVRERSAVFSMHE
jgi:hypothetical protein